MDPSTRTLVAGYLQKADNKLRVSVRLLAGGDYEDAVSRAYYAAYHATQALLLSEGEKADTHKGLVTLFGLLFVKTGKFPKELGKYLTTLKDDRENGDYEVLSYLDRDAAEAAVSEATQFVDAARRYLQQIGAFPSP
ncbi:MAG: HEPN domain-containing protein [Acidobacteria bacterium]|nr:HEPN domain-containing protein [Acidobacteriota bacterium]